MFKILRSKKSIIIFYAIEVAVTAALFLWLYNLTTSTGNIKFSVHTGSVEEVATFVALGTLGMDPWINTRPRCRPFSRNRQYDSKINAGKEALNLHGHLL